MTYSTNELITAFLARQIADDDLCFVGVGTNGRAFTLAVGIPLAAVSLAQRRHAPGAAVYWGNLLEPDLSDIPANFTQDAFTNWPAAACPADTGVKCDMLMRGKFDVSFNSAAQIDRHGNMNITAIGDYRNPTVRLVGSLAQPEHLAFVRRPFYVVDLGKRTFVEKVDFITSVGYLDGGNSRREAGLGEGGPALVVTDKAIFDFTPDTREIRLVSLHPGVTREEVFDCMGFVPVVSSALGVTQEPDASELHTIRTAIDPNRVLLKV